MVANLGGNLIWVAKFRAFRGYSNPIFKTVPSYLSMGRKFGNRGSLFISLVFCRISLAAGWYFNLSSHPEACSLSPRGHHGHAVAQKNFKWLLRIRGMNNFQLSRMHLKGICWEVDSLFPIWKTVMPERKRIKEEKPNRTPILWVDFLRGESFWSLSYSVLLQLRARHLLVRVQIPRLLGMWQPSGDWIPGHVKAGQFSENWVPGQVKACLPPGTPELVDPWPDWGMTNFWGPDP